MTEDGFAEDVILMVLDLDDWDVFDRTEVVTYAVYAPGGTATQHASVKALFMAVDHQSVLGEMVGTLKRATCHIRRSTLPGVIPAMGDRVTRQDGTVWVVLPDGVSKQTDAVRWRLLCQLLESL